MEGETREMEAVYRFPSSTLPFSAGGGYEEWARGRSCVRPCSASSSSRGAGAARRVTNGLGESREQRTRKRWTGREEEYVRFAAADCALFAAEYCARNSNVNKGRRRKRTRETSTYDKTGEETDENRGDVGEGSRVSEEEDAGGSDGKLVESTDHRLREGKGSDEETISTRDCNVRK